MLLKGDLDISFGPNHFFLHLSKNSIHLSKFYLHFFSKSYYELVRTIHLVYTERTRDCLANYGTFSYHCISIKGI